MASKKKRNKKYVPKLVKSDAFYAAGVAQQAGPQTIYDLQMEWDVLDTNRMVDMYCAFEGITDPDAPIPLDILRRVYKGDLIIAVRKNLIDKQAFKIEASAVIKNVGTGKDTPVTYRFECPQKVDYTNFLTGANFSVLRKGGIKTRWKGVNTELNLWLEEKFPGEEFEFTSLHAKLSCSTKFINFAAEKEFKKIAAQVKLS